MAEPEILANFVGGRWVPASATDHVDVYNPARGVVIARTPLSTGADVDAAVKAATAAFPAWSETPPVVRARSLFAFKAKLEAHAEELARLVTLEHGKTLDESRGSVRRGIECVEVACGGPSLLMGYGLENISAGSRLHGDAPADRRLRGDRPVQFPGDGPALVPAVRHRLRQHVRRSSPPSRCRCRSAGCSSCCRTCDLPPGVVNLVNGGKEVVEAICDHPGIRAVSFVGSTPVARLVYQRATHAGKRVQALGGAKNFVVVMPDADFEKAIPHHHRVVLRLRGRALPGGQRAGAGRRSAQGSPRPAGGRRRSAAASATGWSRRRHGAGDQRAPQGEGPGLHRERRGRRGEARRRRPEADAADGTGSSSGRRCSTTVSPAMSIGREEIFGPVASVCPAKDLDEVFALMHAHPNANATSIFTSSGKAAREFAHRATASMVGVNIGVAAPDGVLPVRRRQGQLLRRPQGARPRRVRVLHGQEGHDQPVVLSDTKQGPSHEDTKHERRPLTREHTHARIVTGGLIQAAAPITDPGAPIEKIRKAAIDAHMPFIEEAGQARRADPRAAGDLQRPVLLPVAGRALVRHRRAGARADDRADGAATRRSTRWRWSCRSTSASRPASTTTPPPSTTRRDVPGQVPEEPHPAHVGVLGEVLLQAGKPRLPGVPDALREDRRLHLLRPALPGGRAAPRPERRRDRVQPVGDRRGAVAVPVEARAAGARRRQRLLHGLQQPRRHRSAVEHRPVLRVVLFRRSARATSSPRAPRTRTSSSWPRWTST